MRLIKFADYHQIVFKKLLSIKVKNVAKPNNKVIRNTKVMNIFFFNKINHYDLYNVLYIFIMNTCFIILAGGESKRFNSNIPKPYINYKGKPLLLHSIDKAKVFRFNKIVLVINKKHKDYVKKTQYQRC